MAIDFPNTPTSGDNHTVGDKSWQWDGEKWNTKGTFVSPSILKINKATGRIGVNNQSPSHDLDITGTARVTSSITLGGNLTFDSKTLSVIQGSADTFTDNDTSLMTSAAIDDRINAAAGGGGTIEGVTAGTGLSGGGTSGTVTLNVAGVTVSELAGAAVQTSGEAFADNNTSLMTSASIQDKILSYGYTTAVGDITGVTAGSHLTGGGTSGTVTLNVNAYSSAGNSTVVARTGSGHIYANYFNTTPNTVTSGVTQVCVETGNDGFIRHGTAAAVRTFLNVANGATANVGDITGVTAGTNLNGGGTSGAVTLNVDASPEFTIVTVSDEVRLGNGSATDPSLTFSSDGDVGLYRKTTNQLGITVGGVIHYFKNDGLHLASNDWFRTNGTGGWLNTTYNGGWNMEDTTWVRTHNNKGMLCNGIAAALSSTSSLSGYKYVVRNSTYTSFAYYTSSQDYKDQITPFTDSGAIIDALHPVTFVEKPNEENSPEEAAWRAADLNYGFIAEDIAGDPLTAHLGQYDDVDGELKPEGWKWPDMISVLTAEVKSLRQRVEVLETP